MEKDSKDSKQKPKSDEGKKAPEPKAHGKSFNQRGVEKVG